MLLLRLIVLVLYIGALFGLAPYIRDHPPRFEGKFVHPLMRLLWALLRMWGPLLWFLPGLLWIGMLPVSFWTILRFSFFIPLSIFLTYLWATGAFPSFSNTRFSALIARALWGICLVAALVAFRDLGVGLFNAPPTLPTVLKFVLFFIFVTFPAALAVMTVISGISTVIPAPADEETSSMPEQFQLFTGFFTTFPKPSWIVEDGAVKTQIEGQTFYGSGPGWIMTEPENVVILKASSSLKRIVGPGVAFTQATESPYQVIDLRNQSRSTRTTAMTRDGIEISLPISSLFRIYPGQRKIDLQSLARQEPWPYHNKRTIFELVLSQEVDPTDKTPLEAQQARPWDDIPLKTALSRLKQVVPEYSLEDIYSLDDESTLTRLAIAKRVRAVVKETLEPLGFEILGGGIGNKITPVNPDVIQQRVEAWKARWINKMLEWQTTTEVKRLEALTKVRSKARTDVLAKLLKQVQPLADPEMSIDFVAYHLLENLIHMAQDSHVQGMLPESAMPTLLQLSQMTKEG